MIDPIATLTSEELMAAIREHELATGLWTKVEFKEIETDDPEFWAMEAWVGSSVREVLYTQPNGLASLYRDLYPPRQHTE